MGNRKKKNGLNQPTLFVQEEGSPSTVEEQVELAGVREYSLPVYVSLDGQVFQGGSVSVDTTAEETAGGYPRYTVEDVKDIFDIECFTGFVRYELAESRDSDDDSVLLAIGTEENPGERFVPRTPSGDPITYGWVKWTPTSVGEYRLEHWVDFIFERDDAGDLVISECSTSITIPADGRLWIPSERDGQPIAAIKYQAFHGRSDVRKLVVAEGVADIGGGAFLGCKNLTEVELPASLVHLGRNVFGNAANKSNITSISFAGDAPSYDADIGLDADKCTIHVSESAEGWGNRWQGCPVERR